MSKLGTIALIGGLCVIGILLGNMVVSAADAESGPKAMAEAYTAAFEAKDIDAVMNLFVDDAVMMGTGPGEVWVGKESIRSAHMVFMSNFEKESSERTLLGSGMEGNTAWYTGYSVITQNVEGEKQQFQLNISLVLKKEGDAWKIASFHMSNLTGNVEE